MIAYLTVKSPAAGLLAEELRLASAALADTGSMHAEMAKAGEGYLREYGAQHAPTQHATAQRLGAQPTNTLVQDYARIEGTSTAAAASLWVPGAGRLRAAFGTYTVTPGAGKTYLTIPVAAEAYGRSAREFQGLFFLRAGPKKTPLLAMPDGQGRLTTYYLLVKRATIPEDPDLIKWDRLEEKVTDAAGTYVNDAIETALNSQS